jgi:hypothetical protein
LNVQTRKLPTAPNIRARRPTARAIKNQVSTPEIASGASVKVTVTVPVVAAIVTVVAAIVVASVTVVVVVVVVTAELSEEVTVTLPTDSMASQSTPSEHSSDTKSSVSPLVTALDMESGSFEPESTSTVEVTVELRRLK